MGVALRKPAIARKECRAERSMALAIAGRLMPSGTTLRATRFNTVSLGFMVSLRADLDRVAHR